MASESSKINLGLDLNCLTGNNLTGIGVYARELTQALNRRDELNIRGYVKLSRFQKRERVSERVPVPVSLYGPGEALGLKRLDVLHGLDFRAPKSSKFKKVVTIHDMVVFERIFNSPEAIENGIANFTHMIKTCRPDHLVTVSESVRKRLIEFFPEYSDRSTCVYLGADHSTPVRGSKRLIPEDYILSVSTIEKRKNTLGLVKAFEIAKKNLGPMKLVLIGHAGFEGDKVLDYIQRSPVKADIIWVNYVDNKALGPYYEHASMVAFPSFYEGFGIPVIEALKWGLPTLTSDSTSLTEISGDAALLINPDSVEEIADGLTKIIHDRDLNATLRVRAPIQAAKFSWAKCADENLQVYRKLV